MRDYPGYPSGHNFPTSFDAPHDWAGQLRHPHAGLSLPAPIPASTVSGSPATTTASFTSAPAKDQGGGQLLAYVNGWTSYLEYDKYSSQRSSTKTLAGGQLYYIEAIQKEGGGGDSLTVFWAGPGITADLESPTIIDGMYLVPLEPLVVPNPHPHRHTRGQLRPTCQPALGGKPCFINTTTMAAICSNHKSKMLEPMISTLTGSDMNYNGQWHNEMQPRDPDYEFDMYAWGGNTSAIYNVSPNITTYSYGHTFPTPKKLSPDDSNYFKWTYNQSVFNFWVTPYVRSYPMPNPAQPTPALDPFGGSTLYRNFYWSGDFSSTIYYDVVPAVGPTISCELDLDGILGPVIQPTYTVDSDNDMTLRAVVRGNGAAFQTPIATSMRLRFFVYNSSGTLVHWYTDTSAKYCLFGGNSSCATKRINVDNWWYGSSNKPGPLITNDTYTFVVMAQNNDADNRKKSALDVYEYRLYGPTPTKSPIPPTKNLYTNPADQN